MLTFPTRHIFIEGPDCAGKTTLIKKIHNLTDYKFHISDRSSVSRKIFSELYDRNIPCVYDDFHLELSNLNNIFIFLLPSFEIVKERFLKRGDDIHKDVESLVSVYDAFEREIKNIKAFPNVMVYSWPDTTEIAKHVSRDLLPRENLQIEDISKCVFEFVSCAGGESYPLEFTIYDDCSFSSVDNSAMLYKPEIEYYCGIYAKIHKKIDDELTGNNEYSRVESEKSRRFVYSDDSCISFIQVSIRNGLMDFHTVFRSTDVKTTFPFDLKFLYFLGSTCYKKFNNYCYNVRFRFSLNSAHIL
jgi:deoxyadenosine/deoxycytidine kinase